MNREINRGIVESR